MKAGVCEQGYVPYGWQFKGEKVGIPSTHGKGINCFGLLSRYNHLVFDTTQYTINADFVVEQLERFSLGLKKQTVVVLDNAKGRYLPKSQRTFGVLAK